MKKNTVAKTFDRFAAVLCALVLLLCCALPMAAAEEDDHPFVKIVVQDIGTIYAELYPEFAPITVDNFLRLAGQGFYDGLTFHRVIQGFMIQGGDPKGDGTGGSEENIKGEFSANGVENPLKHTRGVLSMARSSAMDSASSQFFIMHEDASHLDGNYAAFGRVVAGLYTVDKICQLSPVIDNNGTVRQGHQAVIESIAPVSAEEALGAVQAEKENEASSVYHLPWSRMQIALPEGWALDPERSVGVNFVFNNESGADVAEIALMDFWLLITRLGATGRFGFEAREDVSLAGPESEPPYFSKAVLSTVSGATIRRVSLLTRKQPIIGKNAFPAVSVQKFAPKKLISSQQKDTSLIVPAAVPAVSVKKPALDKV